MQRKLSLTLLLTLVTMASLYAQASLPWNGKKCAVVLTYDDALNVHLDNAVPLLDSLGFKGTFYLSGYFPGFKNRINDWRKAGANGHELANHTLFHPCVGNTKGREWVKPDYAMEKYTLQRMRDEMRMTNVLLKTLDGKSVRTFAYPCGDTRIGDSLYITGMREDFIASRGTKSESLTITEINLDEVGCYSVNGQKGEELVQLVRQGMTKNSLVVFLFHGVGGEHGLNVSLRDHRLLLKFLKQNEKDIWITTMVEAAGQVRKGQGK
jgi:peptidoglycan/xylan/chitin deacetylase (PgdA/CDA1 family)